MTQTYKGMAFPFRFDSSGSTSTSELTPDDYSLVEQSLYQIWFTDEGERVMEDFGTKIRQHIFESTGDETDMAILKFDMMKAAKKYEDKIVVNDIRFDQHPDIESAIIIYADITITKYLKDVTIEMTYERT